MLPEDTFWCLQAVMVAWAQATIPPNSDAKQPLPSELTADVKPLGRTGPASGIVSKALAAISDPFVQLHSQTKNI